MRNVDPAFAVLHVAAGGEQPRVGQSPHDSLGRLAFTLSRDQLAQNRPPTGVLGAVALFGQPQKDVSRDHLLVGTEPAVNRLSPLGDCRLDAAAGTVALERQQTASSPRPQLEQRVLEEWQCSRLTRDVVQDRVHQARLESESHSPRRPLDRLAQAWGIEAAQQMLMRGHTRGQVWIHGAARIEVRAHRHDNLGRSIRDRGRVEQIGYELGPLLLVSALRKNFLELVHHQQNPGMRWTAGERRRDRQVQRPIVARQPIHGALQRAWP